MKVLVEVRRWPCVLLGQKQVENSTPFSRNCIVVKTEGVGGIVHSSTVRWYGCFFARTVNEILLSVFQLTLLGFIFNSLTFMIGLSGFWQAQR